MRWRLLEWISTPEEKATHVRHLMVSQTELFSLQRPERRSLLYMTRHSGLISKPTKEKIPRFPRHESRYDNGAADTFGANHARIFFVHSDWRACISGAGLCRPAGFGFKIYPCVPLNRPSSFLPPKFLKFMNFGRTIEIKKFLAYHPTSMTRTVLAPSSTGSVKPDIPVPRAVPTSRDWDALYPEIQRLYVRERRKLRYVMQYVETKYGFKAT